MKKAFAMILSFVLVISVIGCAAESTVEESVSSVWEVSEKPVQTEITAFDKDEEEISDPLVICMDVVHVGRELLQDPSVAVNDFLMSLEQTGGIDDVVVAFIPGEGAERESMLNRLRVELMSGKGPDVFIVNCDGVYGNRYGEGKALFMQPQKNMESGLFLPLDPYMESSTQFTDWSCQNAAVLAEGRNEEGQQIIPLTYTLPVLCCRQSELSYQPEQTAAWHDLWSDSEYAEYTKYMADCAVGIETQNGPQMGTNAIGYLSAILGKLADYEAEELNFTQEELLLRLEEIVALFDEAERSFKSGAEEPDFFEEHIGWELVSDVHQIRENIRIDEAKTMIPLYSDDGGAAATIMSWAAVNRNTKRPEEAYAVIDMLLREETVVNSLLYADLLLDMTTGIPLNDEILSPEKPMRRGKSWSLSAENYAALCEVRGQITEANFDSRIDVILDDLLMECILALRVENPEGIEAAAAEAYEQMERLVRE